jgi:hypothetical protein
VAREAERELHDVAGDAPVGWLEREQDARHARSMPGGRRMLAP